MSENGKEYTRCPEENALTVEATKNHSKNIRGPKVVRGNRLGNSDIINALVGVRLLQ